MRIDNLFQNLLQTLLSNMEIYFQKKFIARNAPVNESRSCGRISLNRKRPSVRLYVVMDRLAVRQSLFTAHLNNRLQRDCSVFIRKDRLIDILEGFSFTFDTRSLLRQIVDTEDHIL